MDTPPLIEQEITNLLWNLVKANKYRLDLNETNIRSYVDQIVNSLRVDSVCFRIIQKVGSDWMSYIDFDRVLDSLKESTAKYAEGTVETVETVATSTQN